LSNGYETGFHDVEEAEPVTLPWQGEPPSWLQGTLFRNGPGRYNRGQVEVNHWFDGLALLHALRITPEDVTYHSRFVRSHDYRTAELEGEIAAPGFACDPCRSLFRKVASLFSLDATDNPNVNLIKQGERFLALTELPLPMEFDPKTLRSINPLLYRDSIPRGSTTAHPHQDGPYLYNQVLFYSARSTYRFYRQLDLEEREEFARVPVGDISYVHSFGLSRNHLVLTCCPFQVAPWRLLVRDKPFIENFSWQPETGTRFHIVARPGNEAVRHTLKAEPFFCFHHVNSFQTEKDSLLVDLVAYPTARIIQQLKLSHLRAGRAIDFGKLRRYRVDLPSNKVERVWESTHCLELPRLHYSRVNSRAYDYVYGVSADPEHSTFYDRLVKLRVNTDQAEYWHQPHTYPGEPVFVPHPEGQDEDHGVLLSVILNATSGNSFLLVLEASTMRELARVELPTLIPHGFHGMFDPAPSPTES
jgi:beta,beta-carotene 9',10'-dioxygenase